MNGEHSKNLTSKNLKGTLQPLTKTCDYKIITSALKDRHTPHSRNNPEVEDFSIIGKPETTPLIASGLNILK